MHEVSLPGCTPEPLMGYLKALGVFRLVAEQADPSATLCWKGGIACLTSKLDREGLVAFFRDEYQPTPVLAPWNGGSGFLSEGDEESPLGMLKASKTERLDLMRSAIEATEAVVAPLSQARRSWKELEAQKKSLERARRQVPDELKERLGLAKKLLDSRKNGLQTSLSDQFAFDSRSTGGLYVG